MGHKRRNPSARGVSVPHAADDGSITSGWDESAPAPRRGQRTSRLEIPPVIDNPRFPSKNADAVLLAGLQKCPGVFRPHAELAVPRDETPLHDFRRERRRCVHAAGWRGFEMQMNAAKFSYCIVAIGAGWRPGGRSP